ncbi:extracellular solute-binding protein [Streptomyces sp. NPDC004647]|uniref:extracellular solute-binding protein n=1 Tax=Streptomyces sp. NPDC004647 TaxID=3154671 RepID=UPI0033BBBD6F
MATASDVSQGPVRQRLIEAWDAAQPDVRVEIVKLPAAADNARSQLVAELQSGSADYDVVNIDVAWTAEFAAGKLIRPLDWSLPEGMWPQVAETARLGGETWAVPFNTDAALLYYRNDIWKDENWQPPTSWGELNTLAAEVEDENQVEQTFPKGYATQLDSYEGLTVNAQEAVWAHGGELVDSEGEVRARSPETQQGLSDLVERYNEVMPKESITADERDTLEMFRDEEVAFMRNWPYVYNVLSAEGSKVKGKFGVVPLPVLVGRAGSVLGGQNLAITESSDHSADARRLLRYLVRPAQQRCLLDAGFAPVLRESYEPGGPACSLPDSGSAGGGSSEAGSSGGDSGGKDEEGGEDEDPGQVAEKGADGLPEYTDELKAALGNARTRPVTPYYAAFTELVQTKVHKMLEGDPGKDTVATALDRSLRKVLKGG